MMRFEGGRRIARLRGSSVFRLVIRLPQTPLLPHLTIAAFHVFDEGGSVHERRRFEAGSEPSPELASSHYVKSELHVPFHIVIGGHGDQFGRSQ